MNLVARLEAQFKTIEFVLAGSTPKLLLWQPESGKWSVHHNLAHLGRYHQVFKGRLEQILSQDSPSFGRYRAEDDPGFAEWVAMSSEQVLEQMRVERAGLVERLRALSAEQWKRTGVHPLRSMDVGGWLEFFLIHELHHCYTMLLRLGEAKRALNG